MGGKTSFSGSTCVCDQNFLSFDMKIGLISDTHGWLDPNVIAHFAQCDEVWHAGDIGELDVARELEKHKPLRAVHGNIDDREIRIRYPEDLVFDCEGMRIWITHIGGTPPRYNPRVKKLLTVHKPAIFICGHSHILCIGRDPSLNEMLYVNPGAAGNHGFHHMRTIVRFDISSGGVSDVEVIELGKRGQLLS
jgi:putative phosphoesterase